jgi:hypothetical protein
MNRLPKPENRSMFHNEMFNRHTHAEQVYEYNPDEIVYREKDVLELMRLVKREVLEWAAKNAKIKTLKIPYTGVRAGDPETAWYPQFIVDKQSILKGKKSKKLKI